MNASNTNSTSSHIASVVNLPGYKIKDILGRGGMAVVYLAIQESIGREVALKVLVPDHTDSDFSERFLREARIISQLSHPNIVTIYDAGIHQGCHYMSMEYIPGPNLRQARDTLSRKEKINVIKQIAKALEYAGNKGFVHRDIKPENIILHEDGRAVLTDFGIARGMEVSQSLTVTGKAIGTPYYMSPEQTKGLKDIDHRSDIYSLGVVLFQYLAGHLPYTGDSIVTIGIKHISDPVPFLPRGLEIFQPVIDKSMAKNPEQRYQTAGEFYAALDAISNAQLDEIDQKLEAQLQSGKEHHGETLMIDDVQIIPPSRSGSHPINSSEKHAVKSGATQHKPVGQQKADGSIANYSSKTARTPSGFNITQTGEYKKLARRNRIVLLLLLLTISTLAYYKQNDIFVFWQQTVVPISNQLINKIALYTSGENKTTASMDSAGNQPMPAGAEPSANSVTASSSEYSLISQLRDSLESSPENLTQLVAAYNERLATVQDPSDITQSLNEIEQQFYAIIKTNIKNNNISKARDLLDLVKENYPASGNAEQQQKIEATLNRQETISNHLKMAQVYINTQSLTEPENANAWSELQAVLNLDPENINAKELIQEITNIFIIRASQQQTSGKLDDALQTVTTGLEISTNDPALLKLKNEISAQLEQQHQLEQLLTKARKQYSAGKLITPAGDNAYETYRATLSQDSNNNAARKGLINIAAALARNIRQAIKEQDFDKASKMLDQAQKYYKNTAVIKKSALELEQAIDAVTPKITQILFSDNEIQSLTEIQKETIQPGRVLYIGFNYRNFSNESTVIQANLLDGSGKVQIAQKPVIVSGNSGQHIFYIELPVEGFADGAYILELLLNNQHLIKEAFQVKNKITE